MLFDPMPKEIRRELFDREKELKELEICSRSGSPLILCLGIRRIGKTSLLKVFLNESGLPGIYIDVRKLSEHGYSKAGLYKLLSESLTGISRFKNIAERLKSIKGISIGQFSVELDWRRGSSITSILEKFDEYAESRGDVSLVIVDEAQGLRYLRGHGKLDFRQIIAYSYDNLRKVKFVLSGSEVGLLYGFLGFDNYYSPLYGRVRDEIVVERFSRETSIEFLRAGFREAGLNVPEEVMEESVEAFDGIPGWLSFYGYRVVRKGRFDITEVVEEASKVALSELLKLRSYSELYPHLLRAIAEGYEEWKGIKRTVEAWTGRTLSDQTIYNCLNRLIDMSILTKKEGKYKFLDPIYREAARKL